MNKLRALHYLRSAAMERSFSGAARSLNVSVPAIAKLIGALEKDLGMVIFDRTTHGLTLTAGGAGYLDACAPALAQLDEADDQARALASRLRGTLVVSVQPVIARACLTAALPRFHSRHPDIELDIRNVEHERDEAMPGVDVTLVLGWPKSESLVCRRLGAGRYMVVASPAYWATRGEPSRPKDLERHECIAVRGIDGAVMDVWTFSRGEERESALVRGWATISHAHRDLFIELALAGHGVLRVLDWLNQEEVGSGRLVPVLSDWESTETVPVNLLYAPGMRRLPRARAFIDFIAELFAELDRKRASPVSGSERPSWMRRPHGRASDVVAWKTN